MRILTGKDRQAYESLLVQNARLLAREEAAEAWADHLGKMLVDMQKNADRERQRADNAVDALLALRGIPPITPGPSTSSIPLDDVRTEDPDEVTRIEEQMKATGFIAGFGVT